MPSIEVAAFAASSEHPDRLFKAHKPLPRQGSVGRKAPDGQISPREHDAKQPVTTAPVLPLTPPGFTRDESPTEADMQKPVTLRPVVVAMTPSKPSHPPTPDTTPPRGIPSGRPGLCQFGYVSSSSRAESFQTAYEMISDAETVTPRPSPPAVSRSNTQKSTRSTRANKGLDRTVTRAKEDTPARDLSPSFRPSRSSVSKDRSSQEHEKGSPTLAPRKQGLLDDQVPYLHFKPIRSTSNQSPETGDLDVSGTEAPTRGRSLRDREAPVPQLGDCPAMDEFRQKIGWPSADDHLSTADHEDPKCLSGISVSTTIEAVIIDPPKPARRSLRHTEKRSSLRSASSPITRAERTSMTSGSHSHHRLSHKSARITENDRRSIVSEISMSGSSTLGAPQKSVEVVPVIVIPKRRSSLKVPSNTSSRNPSLPGSQTPSRRARRGLKTRPGTLNLPRQKKRTVSDSHAGTDRRGRSLSRPDIPPRSSSLSAPTSRGNSRTTSLTSESLRSHNLVLEKAEMNRTLPEQPKPAPLAVPGCPSEDKPEAAEMIKTQSILIGVEDISFLRPPSLPFSPHSIPSSSPGPIEINEARRVAIFPHNNESLLLVNSQGESGLRGLPRPVDLPQTPDLAQQPIVNVDSPLRNPRPPPLPPVSTAGHNLEPDFDQPSGQGNSEAEPLSHSIRQSGYKRRERILRPRSESFNFFVRSLSLSSAKNPKAGEDIDGRLQPFWRPRRFWEDSPESLSLEEGISQSQTINQPDEVISNSVGMPQKRIIFNGPTLTTGRQGRKQRTDNYRRANRESLMGSRIFTPEALYSQTSLHQRKFPAMSWWRLRLGSGMALSLRRRFRRSMQLRAEERREARRAKLKQSIGEAVLVNSSIQVRKAIQ